VAAVPTRLSAKWITSPADLKQVTVRMEPDPVLALERTTANEIWGKPIVLENVPLERFDLKDTPSTP